MFFRPRVLEVSAEVLSLHYLQYRAWMATPLGALELLRGSLEQRPPFRLLLDVPLVRRDLQAAVNQAIPQLRGAADTSENVASGQMSEVLTRLEQTQIQLQYEEGRHHDADRKLQVLEEQLAALQRELHSTRLNLQVERHHGAGLQTELIHLRDQWREARLLLVQHRSADQARPAGEPQ